MVSCPYRCEPELSPADVYVHERRSFTSILSLTKSFETIFSESNALVQQIDNTPKLGLWRLPCQTRDQIVAEEKEGVKRTGNMDAWMPKLFKNSRTYSRKRARKEV